MYLRCKQKPLILSFQIYWICLIRECSNKSVPGPLPAVGAKAPTLRIPTSAKLHECSRSPNFNTALRYKSIWFHFYQLLTIRFI